VTSTPTGHARWYFLCMDTAEPDSRLGQFWAAVAGGDLRPSDGEPVNEVVVPGVEGGGIALCRVPEPKSVKHRVHLDVYAASIADLEALGASMVLPAEESGFPWSVMTDPEGGEFCAFLRPRDALRDYRLHGLVVDCRDPERVARWWGDRFGCAVDDNEGRGFFTLDDVPGMPIDTFDFVPVPEPKTVKNRVHWDVFGHKDDFVAAGATLLRERDDQIHWDVLADPEGNEFCVFTPKDDDGPAQ
jgi:hypothetical protein